MPLAKSANCSVKNVRVSIGLPTYNRPELLSRCIESIIRQSYTNWELIISDNASPGDETRKVIERFASEDKRIKTFYQVKNLGAVFNHRFVLEKATGGFFMWMSDDDYFVSDNLIERLFLSCQEKLLAFPDFNFYFGNNQIEQGALNKIYGKSDSAYDYLLALSKFGYGHPIHGLFNLTKVKEAGLALDIDNLSYYSEGNLLHKVFLTGKVVFVPDVCMHYDYTSSNRPPPLLKLHEYNTYIKKVIVTHLKSHLTLVNKVRLIKAILTSSSCYQKGLLKDLWSRNLRLKTVLYSLKNPMVLFLILVSMALSALRVRAVQRWWSKIKTSLLKTMIS